MNQELPLFVYGTLMQGFGSPLTREFVQGAELLGPASVCGKLYRIDWYPGAVPGTAKSDVVHGELYRIHHKLLWQVLDNYEGVGKGHELPCEYVREVIRLNDTPSPDFCKAWIYWYNWSVPLECEIMSGKFDNKSGQSASE